MPGRHATATHEGAPRGRILATLLAVVVVLAVGAVGVRALIDARSDSCDAADHLDVAADPGLAEVLAELARDYEGTMHAAGDSCVEVSVTGIPAAEVVPVIGTENSPELWIPDSSVWTQRLDEPRAVEALGQIATSPLVVVAPRSGANELGWPDGEFSWRVLLGVGQAALPDPMTTTEGMAGVMAVQAALADADDIERVGAMSAMARAAVPDVTSAYERFAPISSPAVFVGSEQSVIAHNQRADGDRVVAIYPEEGTFALDFPALGTEAGRADSTTRELMSGFVDFIRSPAAVQKLQSAGFRSPDGLAAENAGVVDGTQPGMPELLPAPDPEAVGALLQQWSALAREMRMLTVIDVSGSMNVVLASGQTRIEVTRDAALSAVELLRPGSEVGLWVFSTLLDPPDHHHIELAPVAQLDGDDGGETHLEVLTGALESLPDQVGGGTALYDTALAAFRHMQEGYDPERVNSVVLMTDGRDEDNPASIGLERLLNTLADEFDPENPVPIITIGVGPDADADALQQISEITGTTSYRAEDADDIEEVFMRAMIERQCRPNC